MKFALTTSAIFASLLLVASPAQARNYDCSKAGNANKAACKGKVPTTVASTLAPAPAAITAPMAKTRNYDCTKLGNKFRAVCSGQNAAAPSPTSQAVASTTEMPSPAMRGGDKPTHAGGPNGATAMCKDGTYSHSAHHSGTCSGHKGVATWY